MRQTIDEGLESLRRLAAKAGGQGKNRNEATTRLQLIDQLFFECLGWDRDQDVVLEEPQDGKYADYVFSAPRRALIVEAKKEGEYFTLPAGTKPPFQPLVAITRGNPKLEAALEQVTDYCHTRGVPLAAVCNGHQLVAFVATRVDGRAWKDGRALVLSSLDDMDEHFRELWDGLSKIAVEEKRLLHQLTSVEAPKLPPKLSTRILHYPGTKNRNPFQTELQIVSELVLEDVTRSRDFEDEFLRDCYCPSGALSQYALVSKSILEARYSALFDEGSPGPTTTPVATREGISEDLVADSLSRRPILIIGDVGAGKTMFLRHLIKIEAAEIFENAISLYVDLGVRATLVTKLHDFILDEIAVQLREQYGVDIFERQFVRGVYNLDLERFRAGIYKDLRETDPTAYLQKEIGFLEATLEKRAEHVRRSLEHLARGRRQQIVLFIDNADQRDDETQQSAFLIAQEAADQWPVTVFVTLRPETFHRSIKSGALSGYHPKAFTVSPPRIDRVVEKRLDFALRITSGELPVKTATTQMRVSLGQLDTVLRAFLDSVRHFRPLVELLDNLSGGNVRQALDLVKNFLGSGHVNTQKIVDIYTRTGRYTVGIHEFQRATIYGDGVHYDPTSRTPIANLFDISHPDPYEHFLLPILLGLVGSWTGVGVKDGFVDLNLLYERLQGFGYTAAQIDSALLRAERHRLVEPAGRRTGMATPDGPTAVRVTTVGMYHLMRLPETFAYVDAMTVDTPILDEDTRAAILDVDRVSDRVERADSFKAYLDDSWAFGEEVVPAFDWPTVSSHLGEDIERVRGIVTRLMEAQEDEDEGTADGDGGA